MDLSKHCIVRPGNKLRLRDRDPRDTFGKRRDDKALEKTLNRLRELQHLLYADKRYALLIVLQGLDASGKDGTIRNVMSGVNPQGCEVTSFKAPSVEELAHDFCGASTKPSRTWEISGSSTAPTTRMCSSFESTNLVPREVWQKRFRQINDFEQMLTENGVAILKFFLHISRKSSGIASKRASGTLREIGSSPCPTSRNASTGPTTPRLMRRFSVNAAPPALPGTSFRPTTSGSGTIVVAELIVRALNRMRLKYPPPSVDISKVTLE